jgi:hypothetical protein
MLIVYLQVVTQKGFTKNYHFQDEKYEEKIKRPIKSCEVFIHRPYVCKMKHKFGNLCIL